MAHELAYALAFITTGVGDYNANESRAWEIVERRWNLNDVHDALKIATRTA